MLGDPGGKADEKPGRAGNAGRVDDGIRNTKVPAGGQWARVCGERTAELA